MSERKCTFNEGFFCKTKLVQRDDRKGCYLLDEIIHQSSNGGLSQKPTTPNEEKSGTGPFWNNQTWNLFAERCTSFSQQGCAFPNEVDSLAANITKEKKERGELF